jgi:hypothetical protein
VKFFRLYGQQRAILKKTRRRPDIRAFAVVREDWRLLANVDFGPWIPTDLLRTRVESAAERLPEGGHVRCGDVNSQGSFHVTVLDGAGQPLATGSFESHDFAMVVVFLHATARRAVALIRCAESASRQLAAAQGAGTASARE